MAVSAMRVQVSVFFFVLYPAAGAGGQCVCVDSSS